MRSRSRMPPEVMRASSTAIPSSALMGKIRMRLRCMPALMPKGFDDFKELVRKTENEPGLLSVGTVISERLAIERIKSKRNAIVARRKYAVGFLYQRFCNRVRDRRPGRTDWCPLHSALVGRREADGSGHRHGRGYGGCGLRLRGCLWPYGCLRVPGGPSGVVGFGRRRFFMLPRSSHVCKQAH